MSDTTSTFNLIDEPWIGVRTLRGVNEELSIAEVFEGAPGIERLANDMPTQDFAILRVLLAILERSVVRDLDEDDDPVEVWSELWEAEELPLDTISEYLQRWHHRFYLFDDEVPFMQVAGLEACNGSVSEIKKLILEQPDGLPLFSMKAAEGLERIPLGEAARCLVHVHAFDPSGIKTGVNGDPSVKGGKSYPIGTGWAGRLGGIVVEGENLRETLLLNLVLCDWRDIDTLLPFEDDLPVWERPACVPGDEGRNPCGTADLFTWQTRRIRLVRSGEWVTGAVLSNGNKIETHNRQRIETMTTWRRSEAQEKKLKLPSVYLPYTHSASRAFWRGINAQIPERNFERGDAYQAAGNIRWVGELTSAGQLDADTRVVLHAVGMEYGVQSAVVSELIDDRLRLSAYLVSAEGELAAAMVKSCLEATDGAVSTYGRFARRLQLSVGGSTDQAAAAGAKARAEAYFELGSMFRIWVSTIGLHTDLSAARRSWHAKVARLLTRLARVLIARVDTKSILGRSVKTQGGKSAWVSAAGAEQAFITQIRKELPYSFDELPAE